MAEVFKRIFGKESLLAMLQRLVIVVPFFFGAAIWIISSLGNIIDKKLDQKIQPITNYITGKIIQDVEKQFYKITSTPEDVKYMDLVYVIQDYCALDDKYKNPIADDRIKKIRDFYLTLNENKS